MKLLIWLLLFPVAVAIEHYFWAKVRKIDGDRPPSDGVQAFCAFIVLVIYFWVAHYFAVNP